MALSSHDAFAAGGGGRRRRRRGRRGALSEINVTPLVDVMLVLLIVFMISAPLLTAGVPLELPKTSAGAMQDGKPPLTVSIQRDGRIYLGEAETPFAELTARMAAQLEGGDRTRPIYVRADGAAPYATVAQVMGALSSGGFNSIGLITDTGGPASGDAGPNASDATEAEAP